jgi:hypothetical protein
VTFGSVEQRAARAIVGSMTRRRWWTTRLLACAGLALSLPVAGLPASPAEAGRLVVLAGHGPVVGHGPLIRYRVAVEAGIGEDPRAFASRVQATLGDARGWGHRNAFQRVSGSSYRFTVTLASAATTDRLCYPFRTARIYSCYNGGRTVINDYRWRHGATSYAGHLFAYRNYLVSHEIGHALGYRQHRYTCLASGLAPVMMQQTKSLYGCRRNPWPYPAAR